MPRASEGVDLTKMTRLGDGLQGFVQRVDMQYRRIDLCSRIALKHLEIVLFTS
jgi:hypothetical protein